MSLFKLYFRILYLYVQRSYFFLILLPMIHLLVFKDLISAIVIGSILTFYVCAHEYGHIFFLEKYKINYHLHASGILLSVSFDTEDFHKYPFIQRLFVILGGPIIGLIYGIFLLIIFFNVNYLFLFAALIILSEIINLIFGQDGRELEKLIKERKKNNESY